MAGVDDIVVNIVAQVEGLLSGLQTAAHEIEGLTAPVQSLAETLGKLSEAFAAAFAVEKIAEFAEKFAELGEKALNTAFILGTTVQESDRVTTAMRILGVDTDSAARTLQFLGRSIQQSLVDSNSRAAVGFRNLGISMEEVRANANSLTGMLTLVVEKVNGLERAGLQGAGAMRDVLGRGMQTLAPLLRATAEEFQAAQHAAEAHTEAMVENAGGMDKVAQQMHTLGVNVETFGIKMFGLFRQDIEGVIHSLNNLLSIGDSVIGWLKYLGDAFNQVNKDVTEAGHAVERFMRSLAGLGDVAYADIPPKADEGPHGTRKIGTEKAGKGKSAKGSDDRMSEWRDALKQQLQDEQNFLGDSKKEELAYWQDKLQQVGTGTKEDIKLRREVNAEIFSLQKTLAKQAETDAIAEQSYAQKVNDEKLSSERTHLQSLENLGKITAQQRLATEKGLIDQEIAADEEYYHKKEAAAQGDLREITKLEQEEYLQHQKLVDQKAALDDQMLEETHRTWMQIGDSISQAVDRSVLGIIQGTQTIGQAFQKLGQSILEEFVNLGIKKAMTSLWSSLGDLLGIGAGAGGGGGGLLGGIAGLLGLGSLFGGGGAAGLGGGLTASLFGGGAAAGGSGALDALGMLAVLEKGGIIPSAAAGWQVPGNTMAMLHKNEMVLPSHISQGFQDMFSGRGGGGGGHTFNISAWDTVTGSQQLMRNAESVGKAFSTSGISARALSNAGRP
jgi:hypothetical protein